MNTYLRGVSDVVSFRRLAARQDGLLVDEITNLAASCGQTNVFNVSILEKAGAVHATYRALGLDGVKPFRAFYAYRAAAGSSWDLCDLTEHARAYSVKVVADPKLALVADGVQVTFNTGWPDRGFNDIYLMPLTPMPGKPRAVQLHDAERHRVEKNWAFSSAGEAGIAGIYQLDPLITLRQRNVGDEHGPITFDLVRHPERRQRLSSRQLTIGTQPAVTAKGLVLMAHERVTIGRRRAYLGRPMRIETDSSGTSTAVLSPHRFVHSISSMLPRRGAHNRNLLSATYFSGLDVLGGTVRLSYGINDLGFGIAELEEELLWA